MDNKFYQMIPGIGHEELAFLTLISKDITETQLVTFITFYNGERKKPDTIMIGCIIGLLGIGGIQRFMLNQVGMGVLYLLTGGLCYIGTIIDLVNYKKLTFECNQQIATDALRAAKSMSQ